MENNIVPFGKYKGQPLEVMAQDQQYMEWVQQQGWFAQKYPQINTLIVNNFKEPSETPEHNKIQGMFLKDEFCLKLLKEFLSKKDTPYLRKILLDLSGFSCVYEHEGIDVLINISDKTIGFTSIRVEIKPCVGDDYPAILRQIRSFKGFTYNGNNILLTSEYNGIGINKHEFVKLFYTQGIVVLFINDVINQELFYG